MIVLSAAQVAGGVAGGLVALVTLLGLLWRLVSAVVRHIDATKANTTAIAELAVSFSTHIPATDARLTQVETTVSQHAAILSERYPAHA